MTGVTMLLGAAILIVLVLIAILGGHVKTGRLLGQRYVQIGRLSVWPRVRLLRRCTPGRCAYDYVLCRNGCERPVLRPRIRVRPHNPDDWFPEEGWQ